jgi:hypothetical protein
LSNINSSLTSCIAFTNNTGTFINFTNLSPTQLPNNTNLSLQLTNTVINPPSTQPTTSLGIYIIYSDGYLISSINSSLNIVMDTPDIF